MNFRSISYSLSMKKIFFKLTARYTLSCWLLLFGQWARVSVVYSCSVVLCRGQTATLPVLLARCRLGSQPAGPSTLQSVNVSEVSRRRRRERSGHRDLLTLTPQSYQQLFSANICKHLNIWIFPLWYQQLLERLETLTQKLYQFVIIINNL